MSHPEDRGSASPQLADSKPRVAIVIVNFNGGALLDKCLATLRQQTFNALRAIVVDNASSDGSVDGIEQRYPEAAVIRLETNVGFAAGNNAGIAAAEGCEWVACLNPDAFPEPDWLERMLGATAAHPEYAFFGCRLVQAEHPDRLDGTGDVYHVSGRAWRRDHGKAESEGTNEDGEIFAPCAAAALYRRDALLEVGGFDESFFCYFEDVDLAFRLRLRGYRCYYVSSARVRHVGSAITGRRSDFSVYHGHRNLVWTYFKNMPAALMWCYLPLHLLLNLVTILDFAARGKAGVILRAKRDAVIGLGRVLRERQAVQASRRVGAAALRGVMARGLLTLYRQWRAS